MAEFQFPELMKVGEVARALRVDIRTVHAMMSRDELPAIRTGKIVRVPKHAIVGLFEALTDKKPAAAEPKGKAKRRVGARS